MNKQATLEEAKTFLYKAGRLLDRRRFEHLFAEGPREAVIDALRVYQNPDGGFGNALEPDIRCPDSQPVPTEMALILMDETGLYEPDLLDGIIRYLRAITLPEGGFPLVFRSAGRYPHAPWWAAEQDHLPSVNPTGRIIGLLYKQNVRTDFYEEEWFQRNVSYLWHAMGQGVPEDYHEAIHWITFLEHTPEQEKARSYWPVIDEWLQRPGTIERDPDAGGYVHKVLDWAPSRDSYAKRFLAEEEVERHLQALAAQQQEDGGWPISWEAVSSGGETEWRGFLTVERLKTLQSYGVLPQ